MESIEKNSKHNLKEFSTLFSPIFDFIIKNRLEIGDINILDFNDPIDKTNSRKWSPREESRILLWFLIIGSYKNIGKPPEEVGKTMFDYMLLPFYTEGIREFSDLNLSLDTNAKVFKSIVELEPLYFNLFPEFTKYLCSVEQEYFRNMETTINNSKKIGEFENLLLKVSLDNMNDSEWREKNGISRIVYDNITKSTKIPSVQKLKMLKSIGLSKKLN